MAVLFLLSLILVFLYVLHFIIFQCVHCVSFQFVVKDFFVGFTVFVSYGLKDALFSYLIILQFIDGHSEFPNFCYTCSFTFESPLLQLN